MLVALTSYVIAIHIFIANGSDDVAAVIVIGEFAKRAMKQNCMKDTAKRTDAVIKPYVMLFLLEIPGNGFLDLSSFDCYLKDLRSSVHRAL